MADRNQGTPTRATAAGTPLSPQSAKSTGRRRGSQQGQRRNAAPLASIPSNIPGQDPSASQGTASKSVGNAGPAPSDSNAQAPSPGGIAPMASDLPSLDEGAATGGVTQDMEVDGGAPSVGAGAGSLPGGATPVPTSNGTGTLPATPGPGLLRTPLSAARPEFGARSHRAGSQNQTSGAMDDATRIWGTNILVASAKEQVRRFFLHFINTEPATPMGGDAGMPEQSPYMRLLQHVVTERLPFININASDVSNYDPELYSHTVQYPIDMIMIWDDVVAELGAQEAADLNMDMESVQVRFHTLMSSEVKPIRDLDPIHMDTLVSVKGMVTRTSTIIPDLRMAQFRCEQCHDEVTVNVDNGTITEPNQCSTCAKKHTMRLMPNRCAYLNRQVIKMQEDPSTVPEGETPRSLTLYAFDTNVDAAKPGDKVTMTGIFRASRMRVNPRQRALHALFKTYLDVVHIATSSAATRLFKSPEEREDANRARARNSQGTASGSAPMNAEGGTQAGESQGEAASQGDGLGTGTPDDPLADVFAGDLSYEEAAGKEARFRALAADPDIYQKLINSVAPKVIEMDAVKKGLLCQLFGGVSKQVNGRSLVRGEINILLVGDPSVSKSQLLGFVHHVAPRGIYTSGKGSSAVGLTAYVTKDPDSGEMVLESGALVLSDRGICCIDEFDKMSDGARAMLHEVMEQQTVSVAKAGLVSQLNARTSILAGANPKESRYNRDMGIAENINLPPTLLSRFDLIYLLLDVRSDARDWSLGRHLVSLFYPEISESATPPIEMQELREYIAYARARCTPRLNDEAAVELVERYKKLRSQGRLQQVVVATPRQLEALIRISEALARMQLRDVITPTDVEEAYKLWFDAMSSSAANESGQLDMDVLNSGVSAEMRRFLAEALPGIMRDILSGMFRSGRTSVQADDLHKAYMDQLTAAGDGAQAEGIKRINKKQMMSALLQLPDVCNIRGELISKRQ